MGENTEYILPSENRGGIIEERRNPNHAKDGKFTFGKVKMSNFERKHISSYIFTNFPGLVKDSTHAKEIGDYFYAFTVREPGTYRFIIKKKITPKSKEFIDEMRKLFNESE